MTVLLEREGELSSLAAALERARAGQGSVVFVAGEAGIGKTSLVRAFASTTKRVHVGQCEPVAVPAPLAPLHDLAATLAPEFAASLAADPGTIARSLLDVLASDTGTVLIVEDIHWADAATCFASPHGE
jgi:predicted ATPase